jgi:calcium-dependent protein kinase
MGNIIESLCSCCFKNKSRNSLNFPHSLSQDLLDEYKSHNLSVEMEKVSNLKELKIKPSTFIRESTDQPADVYQMIEYINQGSYGKVVKVKPFYINEERAMKIIKKTNRFFGVKENDIYNEIKILKSLDHPNIIKIHEFFSDAINFYIITEYCEEGDLHMKLSKVSYFREGVVLNIMKQILSTISYLHSKGIIHGDLKLENILIDSSRYVNKISEEFSSLNSTDIIINTINSYRAHHSDEYFDIKLIDFGCSKFFRKDEKHSSFIGTAYYIAPEVFKNEYDEKSDIWSCGVIMHMLLTGRIPFEGSDDEEILENIQKGQITLEYVQAKGISKKATDLVKLLLNFDSKSRPSAKQILKHPWLQSSANDEGYIIDLTYSKTVLNNLKSFNAEQKFQQAVVTYITHNLVKKAEVLNLRRIYKMMDKDQDGRISKAELKNAFREIHGTVLADIEVDNIFRSIDHDNNGYIEYEEFLRATVDRNLLLSEWNLRHAYDLFDLDKSGSISVEEVKIIIGGGKNIPDNIITDLLAEIDKKNDEEITYQEFKEIMNKIVK